MKEQLQIAEAIVTGAGSVAAIVILVRDQFAPVRCWIASEPLKSSALNQDFQVVYDSVDGPKRVCGGHLHIVGFSYGRCLPSSDDCLAGDISVRHKSAGIVDIRLKEDEMSGVSVTKSDDTAHWQLGIPADGGSRKEVKRFEVVTSKKGELGVTAQSKKKATIRSKSFNRHGRILMFASLTCMVITILMAMSPAAATGFGSLEWLVIVWGLVLLALVARHYWFGFRMSMVGSRQRKIRSRARADY